MGRGPTNATRRGSARRDAVLPLSAGHGQPGPKKPDPARPGCAIGPGSGLYFGPDGRAGPGSGLRKA